VTNSLEVLHGTVPDEFRTIFDQFSHARMYYDATVVFVKEEREMTEAEICTCR
jgi:hypothetical protein